LESGMKGTPLPDALNVFVIAGSFPYWVKPGARRGTDARPRATDMKNVMARDVLAEPAVLPVLRTLRRTCCVDRHTPLPVKW